MKRSVKNGIMIGAAVLLFGGSVLTMNSVKSSNGNMPSMGNTPPNINENNDEVVQKENNLGDIKEKKKGQRNQNDPRRRGDVSSNNDNTNSNNMPNLKGDSNTPPDMNNRGERPNFNSNEKNAITSGLSTMHYVILGVNSFIIASIVMYLIMSKMNKMTFKETFMVKDNIIINILGVVILTGIFTYLDIYLTNNYFINNNGSSSNIMEMPGSNNSNISYSANKEITSDEKVNSGTYTSSMKDENAISVSKANVTLSNIEVEKSGDSDGGDSTSFYGTNSAILAKDGATLTIENATINTSATGANGVFSYGGSATTNNSSSDGTTVNISNSKITTSSNNSGGIMTTGGGIMNATNLEISTSGISSAAIRSDRGGGKVTVTGGTYKTSGAGSPAIYSTADITVSDAKLISTASEGVVIEGQNSVTLNNVELTDSNTKLNGQSTTYKNIFLYQSMSGDAMNGTAVFTANDSNITTNNGDSFYVTNTKATINLENNTIVNNDNSGNFLRIQKDSWGNSGSNGGDVTLNMTNQRVSGNIMVDSISTLSMTLKNDSYFEGSINSDNTAKNIELKLDSSSTIKLTGDSYITSLVDADTSYSNIDFNGYKLYVNGKIIN